MPSTAFAAQMRRLARSRQVCGLDYPFTLPLKIRGLGAARLVSTPSRLESYSGLGSGLPLQVSPNLGSSASPVSRRALKFGLSPLRLPIPPRAQNLEDRVGIEPTHRGFADLRLTTWLPI